MSFTIQATVLEFPKDKAILKPDICYWSILGSIINWEPIAEQFRYRETHIRVDNEDVAKITWLLPIPNFKGFNPHRHELLLPKFAPKLIIEINGGNAEVVHKDAGCELTIQDLDCKAIGEEYVQHWDAQETVITGPKAEKEGKERWL